MLSIAIFPTLSVAGVVDHVAVDPDDGGGVGLMRKQIPGATGSSTANIFYFCRDSRHSPCRGENGIGSDRCESTPRRRRRGGGRRGRPRRGR